MSFIADYGHIFMTTWYPSSDVYFEQDDAFMSQNSNQLKLIS